MGLFNRKGKEERKSQEAKLEANASKNQLIRFLDQHANSGRIDETIRRQINELKSQLDYVAPTSDRRAIELDNNTKLLFEKFFHAQHRVEYSRNPNEIEQLMLNSNREMFSTCERLIKEQLFDRKGLASDVEKLYSQKELAALPESIRYAYLEKEIERDALAKKWNLEFVIASYSLKIQKMLCEKKCKQLQMQEIRAKGKADSSNEKTYRAQYNQLANEIKLIEEHEQELVYQISQNNEGLGLIDSTKIKKLIEAGDSANGANILEFFKTESKEFAEVAKRVQKNRDIVSGVMDEYKKAKSSTAAPAIPEGAYELADENDALNAHKSAPKDAWDEADEKETLMAQTKN